ncbi:hypothetical protein DRP05_02675 [Archaeoglobales archaeon]|nr:MAG: hypothetical protein DRP05_02675 [Archaeoglobales archaeon]
MILVKTVLWLELKFPRFKEILDEILPKNSVIRVYEKRYNGEIVIYVEIECNRKSVRYAFLPIEDKERFYRSLEDDLKRIVEKEFCV